MGLTSWPLMVAVIAFAVAVLGMTMLLWNRWPRRWAFVCRLVSLLLVMASGAAVLADVVNRMYGFYENVGDLFANTPAQLRGPPLDAAERGRIDHIRITGSGLTRDALIYLPAAYQQQSEQRFPVLELFHGVPGGPHNWADQMHLAATLDREIATHRIPPVIAVVPTDSDPGRDSECVNAVHGQQDETYLAVDVPAYLGAHYRTLAGPGSWATIGYSAGGYCAVNLALHHPERYAAAASLSGYFTPIPDHGLFQGQTSAEQWNSPLWLVGHGQASLPLFLAAGKADEEALRGDKELAAAAKHGPPVRTVVVAAGGHNFNVWYQASPAAFDWLGARLARPG